MDRNMVKCLASGGDEVEVRINYKDETQPSERKRLQCMAFMCCNKCPPVEQQDAYETLEVFS
jgi:hypothetical protein